LLSASVTSDGVSRPLPLRVIVMAPGPRLERTRSMAVAAGASGAAIASCGDCGVGSGTAAAAPAVARDGDVNSSRIRFRALRTAYSSGRDSVTRTRATACPSSPEPCSSVTASMRSFRSTTFDALATDTFRSSTRTVRESGRLTTYAAGSVDSMTTALPCAETPSSRIGVDPADSESPLAPASTATSASCTTRRREFAMLDNCCLIHAPPRWTADFSGFLSASPERADR
jgi:hypothetical protein